MKGWECPKCGQCWSPWKEKCSCIPEKVEPSDPGKIVWQCVVCNKYHPDGLGCPEMTVTS